MRFDNYPAADVLKNQTPTWFKPVKEYQALADAFGGTLDEYTADGEQIYQNFFIQTADANTLSIWEGLFNLHSSSEDPVEYRRERLLQKMTGKVPYTFFDLQNDLTALFGDDYTVSINPATSTLTIVVTSARYGAFDLLYNLLWDVIPAHIQIVANQNVVNNIGGEEIFGAYLAHTYVHYIDAEE